MAKVKLVYPKMPGSGLAPLDHCIAFEKYDGTNLHWVWDHDLGWYAFGTRRDRFDLDEAGIVEFARAHRGLEKAAELFLHDFATPLESILRANDYHKGSAIAFTEFLGPNSFAGSHRKFDKKSLVLIDIQIEGNFIAPDLLVKQFTKVNLAKVVYRGKLTGKFATEVREGKFKVMEGVVCKGGPTGDVWMVKIKTDAYMARLKKSFANQWENYWE